MHRRTNHLFLLVSLICLVFVAQLVFAQAPIAVDGGSTGIPDSGSASSTIIVPNAVTITDVNVSVNISHPHGGDLRITLTHDDTGTSITLLNRLNGPGYTFGCGANAINATFDDSTSATMDSFDCTGNFNANVTGGWQPTDSLSVFNGQSSAGSWTLTIQDLVAGDTGSLTSWRIIFNDLQAIASGASGPALVVPNEGMVTIHGGNSQPVYYAPGSDAIKDGNGNPLILPNDADKNGYDTYVVTEVRLIDEELWVALFLGNSTWGWAPLSRVQQDTLLPPPSNLSTEPAEDNGGKGPTKS